MCRSAACLLSALAGTLRSANGVCIKPDSRAACSTKLTDLLTLAGAGIPVMNTYVAQPHCARHGRPRARGVKGERERQTDRQTIRQLTDAHRSTSDTQTLRQRERDGERQRESDRERQRETERKRTDKQTHRTTTRQTDRQTGRQTDRQTTRPHHPPHAHTPTRPARSDQ